MRRLLGALVAALGLTAAGCEPVQVQVPPEADLAGIRTVAVVATDLPGDPSPVAILLRGEASSRIRRLLPALTLVDPIAGPDALLRLAVVRHGASVPSVRIYVDPRTGQVSCSAWHTATLLVDAAVLTGQTIRWQGILEADRRIDLRCLHHGSVWVPVIGPADYDVRLVDEAADDLGRRLAGYMRTEFRAIKNPRAPPSPPPPDHP